MRGGAGRVAGRNFAPPKTYQRANEPNDMFARGKNPFIEEIPVAPQLVPINDEWSTSIGKEGGVDARDCAAYPASPYCEGDTIRFGSPVGIDFDLRTTGCTTCLYTYPVVGFLRLTPTVICRRDPNCKEELPTLPKVKPVDSSPVSSIRPERKNENIAPDGCINEWEAERQNYWAKEVNDYNSRTDLTVEIITSGWHIPSRYATIEFTDVSFEITPTREEILTDSSRDGYYKKGDIWKYDTFYIHNTRTIRTLEPDGLWHVRTIETGAYRQVYIDFIPNPICSDGTERPKTEPPSPPLPPPPPPLPPPFNRYDPRSNKGKGGKDMCCNECKDSADNTSRLIKEMAEIRRILGDGQFKTLKSLDPLAGKTIPNITEGIDYYSKLLATSLGTAEYPMRVQYRASVDRRIPIEISNHGQYLKWLATELEFLGHDRATMSAQLATIREIDKIEKVLGDPFQINKDAALGIGDGSITGILRNTAKRIGTDSYPIEVPESLLQGTGDKTLKLQSNAEFMHWLTYQFDALVGQFPIDIEVQDIDPLKEGDQKKTITLPNIAEAIAEIYGLTIKTAVNQEVELNMLLRLAAEAIATKNAAVITQDYARANAQFLGYKANFKPRELQYNFDFAGASLDPKSKEPIVLEKLLKTVTGYVQGWQLEDKETIVGFLQKLMFSAGIIKAVFFRGKKQQKELKREIDSMADDQKGKEAKFEAFIKEINDPNSRFNKEATEKPTIKEETPPDSKQGAK
jgi:hypothetical protein